MKTNQSWFNRIIQNEWRVGRFVELLSYKVKKFGKNLVTIDERNTTKTCSKCGKLQRLTLSQRTYKCSCGLEIDRDINSAINILKNIARLVLSPSGICSRN
jgi:putative transposase